MSPVHPFVCNGGVSRGRYVSVAVGCYLLALPPECTKLAGAWAGSSQKAWAGLARLGSAGRQSQNLSLAQLWLKTILNFWAQIGSGSEKKWGLQAQIGSGSENIGIYKLDPIRPILIKMELSVKFLPKLLKVYYFCPTLHMFIKFVIFTYDKV